MPKYYSIADTAELVGYSRQWVGRTIKEYRSYYQPYLKPYRKSYLVEKTAIPLLRDKAHIKKPAKNIQATKEYEQEQEIERLRNLLAEEKKRNDKLQESNEKKEEKILELSGDLSALSKQLAPIIAGYALQQKDQQIPTQALKQPEQPIKEETAPKPKRKGFLSRLFNV